MEQNIFRFILRYSAKQQTYLLFLTLISFPFLYYSLDLPKQIVNQAIGGTDFPQELFGMEMGQIPYLFALSGIFLILVFINGGFKYYINVYKGQLGERMLRRLRYELYARVLRFPLPHFKKMSQGEIIPMITSEVEPVGGFIGDSIVQPLQQGGTLLVYLGFIFVQDPILGAAAIALYPIQGYIIPRLQKRVNQLGKQRVRTVRQLADKVGESVSGVQEIHAHDASAFHLADFAHRLGDIYDIRFEIYRRKFFIKFLNNFINQLTPFFFYSIGGYLVIRGSLSFGALVAVLAAYKDLAAPWKELLDYYQQKEDIRIKYEQVIEQFNPAGIMDEDRQRADPQGIDRLEGRIQAINLSFGEEGGTKILDGVGFSVPLHQRTAIVGGGGSGKEELVLLIAGLLAPTQGRVRIGEHDVSTLPESVIGRRIAYVGPSSFLFTGTIRDNIQYVLRHRPLRAAERDAETQIRMTRRVAEARASGNSDHDLAADWIDYEAAGVDGPQGLRARTLDALGMVDLDDDIYVLGLRGTIDPKIHPHIAEKVLQAREAVRASLEDPALRALVELFDPDRYNTNATVAENLLFGTPVDRTFAIDAMAENPYVLEVLEKVGLTQRFLDIGRQVAETMLELFAGLPPGHEFFEQFSFISSEELPEFQPIVQRASKDGYEVLRPEDRTRLLALPFRLIPARHRLGLIDETVQERLLEARRVFAAGLPKALRGAVEFFEPGTYNAAATIQDNILFGKMAYGQAQVSSKVGKLISHVVGRLNLRQVIVEVGLDHNVGVAGSRLSAVQRQKVALARAIIKNPDLLIVNEATSGMDGVSQTRIHAAILEARRDRGLVWVVHRPGMARDFDYALVLRNGQLVEQGPFEELDKPDTVFKELLAAE